MKKIVITCGILGLFLLYGAGHSKKGMEGQGKSVM